MQTRNFINLRLLISRALALQALPLLLPSFCFGTTTRIVRSKSLYNHITTPPFFSQNCHRPRFIISFPDFCHPMLQENIIVDVSFLYCHGQSWRYYGETIVSSVFQVILAKESLWVFVKFGGINLAIER